METSLKVERELVLERFLLHILIEVAIIQVNTLGADEE